MAETGQKSALWRWHGRPGPTVQTITLSKERGGGSSLKSSFGRKRSIAQHGTHHAQQGTVPVQCTPFEGEGPQGLAVGWFSSQAVLASSWSSTQVLASTYLSTTSPSELPPSIGFVRFYFYLVLYHLLDVEQLNRLRNSFHGLSEGGWRVLRWNDSAQDHDFETRRAITP